MMLLQRRNYSKPKYEYISSIFDPEAQKQTDVSYGVTLYTEFEFRTFISRRLRNVPCGMSKQEIQTFEDALTTSRSQRTCNQRLKSKVTTVLILDTTKDRKRT